MGAPLKYPSAHEQLLKLAKVARAQGVPFDEFWKTAVRPGQRPYTWGKPSAPREIPEGVVIWPQDADDRQVVMAATMGARQGWKRAYNGMEATPRERALGALRPMLQELQAPAA